MGVKRLFQIIKECAPSCIIEKDFKDYKGTVQAIDASLLLYKFCIALIDTENFKNKKDEIIGHLFACFFKTMSMLRYGIIPLWIFDGKPPKIKNDVIDERKKIKDVANTKLLNNCLNYSEKIKLEKRSFTITAKQISELKTLLDYIGINYVSSPGEAEAQCSAMNIYGVCDGVVTEDWDAVLFGCKKMLKDFSNKTNVIEINVDLMMKELQVDHNQMIDFCSILGNDYCSGISGLKPIDAYKKFKNANFNMSDFVTGLKTENKVKFKYNISDNFEEEWKQSRNYYLHAPVQRPDTINTLWKEPQYDKIYNYLVNEKKFNSNIITNKINEMKMIYCSYSKIKHT